MKCDIEKVKVIPYSIRALGSEWSQTLNSQACR